MDMSGESGLFHYGGRMTLSTAPDCAVHGSDIGSHYLDYVHTTDRRNRHTLLRFTI